jgi:large subunit ribosomal protein L24
MPRRIRIGDLVQVTAGADRGRQGKVIAIDAARGRVRVENVRMQKHHVKPGRKIARSGGIIEQEGFVDASNVMLVDPDSGKPSRTGVSTDDKGRRVRVFRKSGQPVPAPAGK